MIRAFIVACTLANSAVAQTVTPCSGQVSAEFIAEPWQDFTRTFANGAVRVALIDTVEPAAAAYSLMILTPPRDNFGFRSCQIIAANGGGFADVMFPALDADYDPDVGLIFTMPVRVYDPKIDGQDTLILDFTVNQATGLVTAGLR